MKHHWIAVEESCRTGAQLFGVGCLIAQGATLLAALALVDTAMLPWPEARTSVSRDARDEGRRAVEVIGTLTNEGVECQAMRSDDGKLYTLLGDLKGFKAGDRVRVVGTEPAASYCMQGITLSIQKIERA